VGADTEQQSAQGKQSRWITRQRLCAVAMHSQHTTSRIAPPHTGTVASNESILPRAYSAVSCIERSAAPAVQCSCRHATRNVVLTCLSADHRPFTALHAQRCQRRSTPAQTMTHRETGAQGLQTPGLPGNWSASSSAAAQSAADFCYALRCQAESRSWRALYVCTGGAAGWLEVLQTQRLSCRLCV